MEASLMREKARAVAAKCYGNKLSEIEAVILAFGKEVAEEAVRHHAESCDMDILVANKELTSKLAAAQAKLAAMTKERDDARIDADHEHANSMEYGSEGMKLYLATREQLIPALAQVATLTAALRFFYEFSCANILNESVRNSPGWRLHESALPPLPADAKGEK